MHRGLLSDLGRHVYGLAAVALGLIEWTWGDFATVWHPVRPGVPHRVALAYVAAACLLLAGAAVQWRRTARPGLLALSVLFVIAALLWLPRVVGYPRIFATWNGFAEEFALAAAALVAHASLDPRGAPSAARTARVGRLLYGLCVVSFGVMHFDAVRETAAMVPAWLPPGQRFWALATGVAFLLAGAALLTGVRAELAARLLALMFASFGAFVWLPSLVAFPHDHTAWAGNAINLAAAGAAWMVADALAARQSALARRVASSGARPTRYAPG